MIPEDNARERSTGEPMAFRRLSHAFVVRCDDPAIGAYVVRVLGRFAVLDALAELQPRAEVVGRRVTERLEPGDVVLLHDADYYSSSGSWRRTAAALPSILDAVAARGVPCVAVTQST